MGPIVHSMRIRCVGESWVATAEVDGVAWMACGADAEDARRNLIELVTSEARASKRDLAVAKAKSKDQLH